MDALITILGPTATGKTKLAVSLAIKLNAEIVSADSRQVYRRMDIGTGKDLSEYQQNEKTIFYHLIDVAEPGIEYNVFQYQQAAIAAIDEIKQKGKQVILCGGSGMYIEALLKGYRLFPVPNNNELRKELEIKDLWELENLLTSLKPIHNKTDVENKERAIRAIEIEHYYQEHPELLEISRPVPSIIFGIKGDRDYIRKRITLRLKERLSGGMIEEVEELIRQGVNPEQLIRYGLEYKYITLYLQGKIDYNMLFQKLNIAIHQFSKRQMTWFRKMERNGFNIHWIDVELSEEEKLKKMEEILIPYDL